MPQRLVIYYVCSLCREESAEEASLTEIKITHGKTKLALEVCKVCTDAEPLASLLRHGQKEKSAAKPAPNELLAGNPDDDVQCQYCSEWFLPRGMNQHLSKIHNVKSKTSAMQESRGRGPHKCPECGFGAKAAQGLAAHRKSAHGVDGTSKAKK